MLTRKPGIPNVRALDVRHINAAVEAIKKRLEAVEAYALTLPTTAQVVQQTETQIVRTQTSAPPASGGPVDAEDLVARFGWNHGEESTRADADSDVHALIWRDEAPRFALPPGITFVWPGPTSTIPSGFILCDNALLQIADYPGLFAAIGVTWGGDGINNFRAPNAQDRYFMGATGGSPAGTLLGNANHLIDFTHQHGAGTLATSSAGSHSHTVSNGSTGVTTGVLTAGSTSGATDAQGDHTHTISGNTANGLTTPIDIRPQSAAVNWVITT
jgi:microcystin-dependent protein